MFEVTVNEGKTFKIERKENQWIVDGEEVQPDFIKISDTEYHLLLNHQSFRLQIEERQGKKQLKITSNGVRCNVDVKSPLDLLLHEMGMDKAGSDRMDILKAPMPGLVLQILVTEGEEVAKDTPLIILEAMKMENVIKAQGSGVVKEIKVKQRDAVEKNQTLITFE